MKLYNLEEPTTQQIQAVAVGIDLGTTNSLVAYSENGKVTVLADKDGDIVLPSAFTILNDKELIGKEAIDSVHPITSIKRLMGKSLEEAKSSILNKLIVAKGNNISIKVSESRGINMTPIEISAAILRRLKRIAEDRLGKEVTSAVVTVPAYFDDAARTATKMAAELAGFKVLRLLNEPTAAAIAYSLDQDTSGPFAVYDLGGGTFDVSVLKMNKGVLQVIATGGDNFLGGDDFDLALASHLGFPSGSMGISQAKKIKEQLMEAERVVGELSGVRYDITLEEFNNLIKPYIEKTIKILRRVLRDAEIQVSELEQTILVGGSTRSSLIKDKLTEFLGKPPISKINPDTTVAIGAALQAETLSGTGGKLLLDVTPLSLGIEILGGINEKIIFRNTPIPIEEARVYTTDRDGQTSIKIHVVQGESNKVAKCRSLAVFELRNLPKLPAGVIRVIVKFKLDADGLLSVSAIEQSSGIKQEIVVKPSYNLEETEVIKLISE